MTPGGTPRRGGVLRRAVRPPVGSTRFWVVQTLAVVIGLIHAAAAGLGPLRPVGLPDSATLVLFLLPVLYAALNFGLAGSIATAAWVTILALPVLVLSDGAGARWVDGAQLAGLDLVSLVVGRSVERERAARQAAEQAGAAHRAAEVRYRALFRGHVAPTLVADADGRVLEANPAAVQLFGHGAVGRQLNDLVPSPARGAPPSLGVLTLHDARGEQRTVRPVEVAVRAPAGGLRLLVFRDVTDEARARGRMAAYAAGVVRAQEEERRAIAAELQDELLQVLVGLARRLQALAAFPGIPPPVVSTLSEAAHLAATIGQGLGATAAGLRPPVLDDLGLEPALRGLVAGAESAAGLAGRLQVIGLEGRLCAAVELTAFRIAQEAIRNVEQHARARQLVVRLACRGDHLHLIIGDDGAGFTLPLSEGAPAGLGLLGMRERAHGLGGSLQVRCRPARGTVVTASLPATPARADCAPVRTAAAAPTVGETDSVGRDGTTVR